jgi:hypothetical protein
MRRLWLDDDNQRGRQMSQDYEKAKSCEVVVNRAVMMIKVVPKDRDMRTIFINAGEITWMYPLGMAKTVVNVRKSYRSDIKLTIPRRYSTVMANLNEDRWQDEERTWMDVDLVYETRWDCTAAPVGDRRRSAA